MIPPLSKRLKRTPPDETPVVFGEYLADSFQEYYKTQQLSASTKELSMHLRHNMFKMFSREHTEHTCSLSFMFYVFVQPFCPFASSTLAPWRCQAQVAGAAIWAALEPAMYILRKGAFARRTGAIASHVASFRSMRHIGFLRCGGVESFCNTDPTPASNSSAWNGGSTTERM